MGGGQIKWLDFDIRKKVLCWVIRKLVFDLKPNNRQQISLLSFNFCVHTCLIGKGASTSISSSMLSTSNICIELLQDYEKTVKQFKHLYGDYQVSHNVHGPLHIASWWCIYSYVWRLELCLSNLSLDSCRAFTFEHMMQIKKLRKKPVVATNCKTHLKKIKVLLKKCSKKY